MFCDEPIIRVYLGRDEYETRDGANAFLDGYHDLAYHVTEGYRIVLETENWAITLDVSGVFKEPKSSFGERPGEWLQDGVELMYPDDTPYVHFESTLFVGERLSDVTKENAHFLCVFDHFSFKVIPYELGTMDQSFHNKDHWSYNHVLGCDRHLSRKCECGGDGEILLDFVADYVVRCKNCKKSTWANMELQSAINDWNNGELQVPQQKILVLGLPCGRSRKERRSNCGVCEGSTEGRRNG